MNNRCSETQLRENIMTERYIAIKNKTAKLFKVIPEFLHCASLLRTIFASSVRAHERAPVQNIRDFPQTELDSEIKALFLLYEHGDPHFLFYKFNENNIRNN